MEEFGLTTHFYFIITNSSTNGLWEIILYFEVPLLSYCIGVLEGSTTAKQTRVTADCLRRVRGINICETASLVGINAMLGTLLTMEITQF